MQMAFPLVNSNVEAVREPLFAKEDYAYGIDFKVPKNRGIGNAGFFSQPR